MALAEASLAGGPLASQWLWHHQHRVGGSSLESTLERLRLPVTYAPALCSLLGSWDRILEIDQSRLAMQVPLILPAEHASRFVGHCATLKQKREVRRNHPAVYGDMQWSLQVAAPMPGYSFVELDSSSHPFHDSSSYSSSSRSAASLTPEPDMHVHGAAGPFDCFALVGQSLRSVFDHAFAKKALG
jgi:hypothetical protein